MLLGDVAHVRTGDKGDISQVSVIAYDPGHYPLLAHAVTVDRVLAHLAELGVRRATRYTLPDLGALNFVLEGALSGGVTRSLALDAHGKTLGAQLLDLPLGGERGDRS
ncbi:AtuA-related protein [Sphingomonas sp.]|uniref:AtuA-related protein n=1 Tax=Sphingomonas sp. TaxID=28214 RepID=UPI003B3A268D